MTIAKPSLGSENQAPIFSELVPMGIGEEAPLAQIFLAASN
jgi:hypothetical protein